MSEEITGTEDSFTHPDSGITVPRAMYPSNKPEVRATEYGVNDVAPENFRNVYGDDDEDFKDDDSTGDDTVLSVSQKLDVLALRLEQISDAQKAQTERMGVLAEGINKIGEMLNYIVGTVSGVAQQFQSGGFAGLMGMIGGGNKSDG